MHIINTFIKKIFNKEVILYLIFGILTTLVDFVVFYYCNNILLMNYILATILAFVFAVIFAYITNKFIVFKSVKKGELLKEIVSFFSLRIISLILSIIFMMVLVEIFNVDELISKILVNFLVVIANYIFSKLYIFKNNM